jgi:hypothetical protein
MLLLSFQKPIKEATNITSAKLDTTSSNNKITTMIATSHQSNPDALQIDTSYQLESLDSFSWADFPIVQHSLVPIPYPSSRPMEMMEMAMKKVQTVVPAKSAESCPKKPIRKEGVRAVMFTSVHVREHAVTVGDHDLCKGGLPITLDWKHSESKSFDIDDFEWRRERVGRMPRGHLPRLDYWQRKNRLRHVAGLTERDMTRMECHQEEARHTYLLSKTVAVFPTEQNELKRVESSLSEILERGEENTQLS